MQHPSHFKIGKCIGRGSFAQVHLARDVEHGSLYAMKIFLQREDEKFQRCISNEIRIHSALNHPGIVKCYGGDSRDDEYYPFLLMEYVEGYSLRDLLKQRFYLSEQKTLFFAQQLLDILQYLNQNRVVHGDLKPENILIGSNGKLKVCDFGMATDPISSHLRAIQGTPGYFFPYLLQCEDVVEAYDHKVDLWSYGVLVHEMLTGKIPHCTFMDTKLEIQLSPHLPSHFIPVLSQLLCEDPSL